ncbi:MULTISPECIES: serine hydrolase [unclassified Microbacterium]|uniref:serine hydrolase n=1 Tax=unclassified Microbacterium TaxID=2609290 RepID=UPI000EA9AD76|nr:MULTISPECIES: serine hydrolase [unclassified Microbacterium]MBT2486268.1 serine hydrolase [Microbacterium sp. ISL-108]RKN68983.1 serine hydrolase [Microbacterium sp. CGR2]
MSAITIDLPRENGTEWSVLVRDVDTGEELLRENARAALATASVGKIFLLHRLLAEVDAGTRSLEERVTRRPVETIDDSGLWYLLQAAELSLYDVAALIGAVSDNAATNTLCRVIGLPAVQQHTRQLGYTDSALDDVIRWPIPPGAPRTLSHGTAEDLVRFMSRLALGDDLSPSSADTLKRWLGAGMDLSMVASAFELDPLAHFGFDRGIWLINKTGTMSSVRADTGIVMSPTRRIAFAVVANWNRGTDGRGPVLAAMNTIGAQIRSELVG